MGGVMIDYKKYVLSNGLTLLVMEDSSTPLVSVNTLYSVGSRDEKPTRTGFAHLFEHLMFGGTSTVPDFDKVVTEMGGESNASTNNDFTQYYLTVPARYLETALMLESDRMRHLDLTHEKLAVQQSVVTEEYNFRYVNRPYGDMWLLLRPLCYKVHPYRWCTIGADIRHVQEATAEDVEEFFERYYNPSNAIVAVAGNVKNDEVIRLVEKWYGSESFDRHTTGRAVSRVRATCLPVEPEQREARFMEVEREVPADALFMAYPTCGRLGDDMPAIDLVSDILSNGSSSRLYNELVKNRAFFGELDAYITGDYDPGLFVISGKLREGVSLDDARRGVEEELQRIATTMVPEIELEKVKNKYESTFCYSQYKTIDCAMAMCYYEWLGHIDWINIEPQLYRKVTAEDICRVSAEMFRPERQNVLYYKGRR